MPPGFDIRPATRDDLPALGRLGAGLLRAHHAFDAKRFIAPGDRPEEGYAWFLGTQLDEPEAVVLVGVVSGDVVGYVYASIEPHSWKELRDRAGFIHDVFVDQVHRRSGLAAALLDGATGWCRGRGVPRVLLWTSSENASAQQLFAKRGFRPTMIEMTLEIE
jgi:GNAT superfamily N-acetyltransferase